MLLTNIFKSIFTKNAKKLSGFFVGVLRIAWSPPGGVTFWMRSRLGLFLVALGKTSSRRPTRTEPVGIGSKGSGLVGFPKSKRKFQHSYPRYPKTQIWKDFLHKQVVEGPGYVPGVCWNFLKPNESFPQNFEKFTNFRWMNFPQNRMKPLLCMCFFWR